MLTCVRTILESTLHVECTQATSLFRLTTSFFTIREQLKRHQFLVHSQACHKFFAICVAHVQWRTRAFLKFKSSCTVLDMQSIHLYCNVRIHTNSTSALIEAPHHVRFVIQHMRELWCMQILSFWCRCLVSNYWSDIQ